MSHEWKERTGNRIHRGKTSKYASYWRERESDIHKLISGEIEFLDVRNITNLGERKNWADSISFTKVYMCYGIAAHMVALAKFAQTLLPEDDTSRYIARLNVYGELTIHRS
jgi:hypothetical protein